MTPNMVITNFSFQISYKGPIMLLNIYYIFIPFCIHVGLMLSMAVDPFQCWLALGTSLGYHVIWDMRFRLPIRHWQHEGHGKRMSLIISLKRLVYKLCMLMVVYNHTVICHVYQKIQLLLN